MHSKPGELVPLQLLRRLQLLFDIGGCVVTASVCHSFSIADSVSISLSTAPCEHLLSRSKSSDSLVVVVLATRAVIVATMVSCLRDVSGSIGGRSGDLTDVMIRFGFAIDKIFHIEPQVASAFPGARASVRLCACACVHVSIYADVVVRLGLPCSLPLRLGH